MFRAAFLRSAAAAASRPAVRSFATFSSSSSRLAIAAASPRAVSFAPRAAAGRAASAVRSYSAAAGLKKEEVEGRIMSLLKGFDKVNDPSNIKPTAHFSNDLGLDSLDTVEVVMAIEEEFSIEIPDKDSEAIHSIDKAVEYILNQPDAH